MPARVVVPENLEPYIDRVFRFALALSRDRHVAEDLTQETFLRAYRSLDQLRKHNSARSWLFRILFNLWKDRCRKKRLPLQDGDYEVEDRGARPLEVLIDAERQQSALQLMQALPAMQRNALFLSAVEQLSNGEISRLLETSENSVKASLSIARKKMREMLSRKAGNNATAQD